MSAYKPHVSLVRMSEEHLANTCNWLKQSESLRRQVDCLQPPTEEGNRDYWLSNWQNKSRKDYAILTAAGAHIGNCGLRDIDLQRRKAQLWIYLGESRGAGNGTEVADQLLFHAFHELKLNRIYLRVIANNQKALNFYLRLGFRIEGRASQDTVCDGHFVDSVFMSLLEKDYRCRVQNIRKVS